MREFSGVERRFAGSEGEREMLHAVRRRVPHGELGRVEPFVAHTVPAFVALLHDLALLVAGGVGFWAPALGALAAAVVCLGMLAEGTGRVSWLRWGLPKQASYNFVVRTTAEQPLGTLVVAAPLDAPPWRATDVPWIRRRRPQRIPFGAALVVTGLLVLRMLAEPWGPRTFEIYVGALLVLAVSAVVNALGSRRPGRGKDEGTGPAVVIELMQRLRADPIPGVDVWFAFTGCGHAYQGGMEAFLALHRKTLVDPVLVVALDDPGRGALRAVVTEGPLFPQPHRSTGPALVERLRWAGVGVGSIDLPGATDARAAGIRGYRALAFSGGDGPVSAEAAARSADVLETVARWFGDDLARVAVNRPALHGLAMATTSPPEHDAVSDGEPTSEGGSS